MVNTKLKGGWPGCVISLLRETIYIHPPVSLVDIEHQLRLRINLH